MAKIEKIKAVKYNGKLYISAWALSTVIAREMTWKIKVNFARVYMTPLERYQHDKRVAVIRARCRRRVHKIVSVYFT